MTDVAFIFQSLCHLHRWTRSPDDLRKNRLVSLALSFIAKQPGALIRLSRVMTLTLHTPLKIWILPRTQGLYGLIDPLILEAPKRRRGIMQKFNA
jgi:hypothetical protein